MIIELFILRISAIIWATEFFNRRKSNLAKSSSRVSSVCLLGSVMMVVLILFAGIFDEGVWYAQS
jgi:hypothetical protein